MEISAKIEAIYHNLLTVEIPCINDVHPSLDMCVSRAQPGFDRSLTSPLPARIVISMPLRQHLN